MRDTLHKRFFGIGKINTSVNTQAPAGFDPVRLCARILNADRNAEHELAERFLPRVRTLLAVRTSDRDAAEELAQECILAALCALRDGKARNPEALAGFVFGIARNLADDFIRRRCKNPAEQLSDSHDRPVPESENASRVSELRDEIGRLDPLDREVLTLTLVDGMEPAEIARSLGISPEAVRQRKSRAVKRLSTRLKPVSRKPLAAPL